MWGSDLEPWTTMKRQRRGWGLLSSSALPALYISVSNRDHYATLASWILGTSSTGLEQWFLKWGPWSPGGLRCIARGALKSLLQNICKLCGGEGGRNQIIIFFFGLSTLPDLINQKVDVALVALCSTVLLQLIVHSLTHTPVKPIFP